MPLPRNSLAKNKKGTKFNKNERFSRTNKNCLDDILVKYKIGEVTFRECKMIDNNGVVTNFSYDKIMGNMRIGILFMFHKSQNTIDEIYDLHNIEIEKIIADMKKNEVIEQPLNDQPFDYNTYASNMMQNKFASEKSKPMSNKSSKFINNIKRKFNIEELTNIRYVETRSTNAYMVINPVNVYKILLSESSPDHVYIFHGDLQMKKDYIKIIDPAYNMQEIIDEQYEFMKRIGKQDSTPPSECIDADLCDNIEHANVTIECIDADLCENIECSTLASERIDTNLCDN